MRAKLWDPRLMASGVNYLISPAASSDPPRLATPECPLYLVVSTNGYKINGEHHGRDIYWSLALSIE